MAKRRKYKKQYTKRFRKTIHAEFIIALIFGGIALVSSVFFSTAQSSSPLRSMASLQTTAIVGGLIIVLVVLIIALFIRFVRLRRQQAKFEKMQTLEELRAMDPYEFEHYVAYLFQRCGYSATVTQAQGDHGIDVIVGKNGKRYAVQVKRYGAKNRIDEPAMREFYGSYRDLGVDGGIYVTTSTFTSPATAWAKSRGIILMDADAVMEMVERVKQSY